MAVIEIVCFVGVGHYCDSVKVSAAAYFTSVSLMYVLIACLHLNAPESKSVRDAQRKLRLVTAGTL